MPYINDEKTAQIRNALAIILRASFNIEQQGKLEDIVRQVGKIGKLLSITDQDELKKKKGG